MSLPNLTCASHSATSERRLTDNISFLFFMSEIVLDTLCFLLCASSPSCTLCAFIYSLSLALSTIAGWWWWFILGQNVSTNMPFHPIVSHCCWSFIAHSHCRYVIFCACTISCKNNCCPFFTWAEIFMIKLYEKNIFIVIQFRDVSDFN